MALSTSVKLVVLAVLLVVGTYGAASAVAYFFQDGLIYKPPENVLPVTARGGEFLRIVPEPGAPHPYPVYAVHVKAPSGAPTIVHFHGHTEQLADTLRIIEPLRAKGFGIFAMEYPGYGQANRQKASESALYAAAEVALAHLEGELKVPRSKMVLQGYGLGSGVAVEMAKRGWGGKVVLISAFTSMVDVFRSRVSLLPAEKLLKERYDNRAKAPSVRIPVLLVHGEDDKVIPAKMSEQLAQAFSSADVRLIPGVGHDDLFTRTAAQGDGVKLSRGRRSAGDPAALEHIVAFVRSSQRETL
jgi:uncharacterized protein